jgi:mRNA-degrading endonuclease RelE of RelBE toxin-antitoxin system
VPYQIDYSPDAVEHLAALTRRQQATVLDTVDHQLEHEPTAVTRNRKPMRANPLAPWELRIGSLRVYYDIEEQPVPTVRVLAVGVKEGNRVRIGGRVMNL